MLSWNQYETIVFFNENHLNLPKGKHALSDNFNELTRSWIRTVPWTSILLIIWSTNDIIFVIEMYSIVSMNWTYVDMKIVQKLAKFWAFTLYSCTNRWTGRHKNDENRNDTVLSSIKDKHFYVKYLKKTVKITSTACFIVFMVWSSSTSMYFSITKRLNSDNGTIFSLHSNNKRTIAYDFWRNGWSSWWHLMLINPFELITYVIVG